MTQQRTGDMTELRELIARVQREWTVCVIDYDEQTAPHRREIIGLTNSPLTGPGFAVYIPPAGSFGRAGECHYLWPKEGTDFEVTGNTLLVYNPDHPAGGRKIVREYEFVPPVEGSEAQ